MKEYAQIYYHLISKHIKIHVYLMGFDLKIPTGRQRIKVTIEM